MPTKPVKQVAAIHDLSGFGRASLTVVIPILSTMGCNVSPLPTAVLSTNSRFPGFHFVDLTDDMVKIIELRIPRHPASDSTRRRPRIPRDSGRLFQ